MTARTLDSSDSAAGPAATRWAGAQVGGVIGLLAILTAAIPALGGGSVEWWITASLPAGIVTGAAVAPGIRTGRRTSGGRIARRCLPRLPRRRPPVSAWLAIETALVGESDPLTIVLNTIAGALLGIVAIGWLATPILTPVAAVGAFALRERTRRAGGGAG